MKLDSTCDGTPKGSQRALPVKRCFIAPLVNASKGLWNMGVIDGKGVESDGRSQYDLCLGRELRASKGEMGNVGHIV